jgi:FXSXX-COOH protein
MESGTLNKGDLADPGDSPFAEALVLEDRESVLVNSIRRVVDAAQRPADDPVAAFNNYI